jgi:predicted Zn-dependent protease with MMP-like domain
MHTREDRRHARRSSHLMHFTPSEFERLVEEALETLPPQFAALLENVAVVVEEEPSDEDLELLDDDHEDDDADGGPGELLGIYRGVALTRRTHDMLPMLPDQIAIFRGPILRIARNRHDAVHEIRDTVIHELGHYFGLHDHEMPY